MSHQCLISIKEAWKLKTKNSNKLFSKGNFKASLLGYEEALCRAEVLNQHLETASDIGIPYLQIFIISCNNIAFTHEKLNSANQGEKMLQRVIYFLIYRHEKSNHNLKEIKTELQRALLTYNDYTQRNNLNVSKIMSLFKNIQGKLKIA